MGERVEARRERFGGPIHLGLRSEPGKAQDAGQCTCPAGPWCQGPASSDWLTCLASACKGCRYLVEGP